MLCYTILYYTILYYTRKCYQSILMRGLGEGVRGEPWIQHSNADGNPPYYAITFGTMSDNAYEAFTKEPENVNVQACHTMVNLTCQALSCYGSSHELPCYDSSHDLPCYDSSHACLAALWFTSGLAVLLFISGSTHAI